MKASKTSRRLLAVFLAFVMSLTCVPEALAAEKSASAVTMQLAKTEGTVEVSNSSGKKITLIKNMRLRSGYKVATEEASYAWTNLDSTKLVKLDAVSEMSIRKSGKKLELLLDSGNIFFNVTEPLSEDESLNIRTSTMVVGIRGTSGWVRITDPWTAEISILDGTVAVSVTDPVTGETKTDTVTAGETAVCKVYDQEHSGDKCEITRDKYTAGDIDGFVLAELDAPLREKIEDASGLDLSGVDAADRLKADQEDIHQKLERIEAEAARQDSNVSTEKVWANPQPDTPSTKPGTSTGTSGGNGGSVPSPAPDESTVTLTMPQTDDTVNDYLSRSAVRTVILKPGTQSQTLASTANMLEVDSGLTVPAGKTLTLQSGVGMTVMGGQTARIAGTMTVGGDLEVGGNVAVSGRLTVDGAFDGRITPQSGAVIRARKFALSPDVSGWEVSETTDSAGYYTLNPARKTYTVTFNANGGTVASASAQTGTDGRLSSLPVPVREGYTFNGWFTSATGGERVTSAYVFTANTTVYAHWSVIATHPTMDFNGHTYHLIDTSLNWAEAKAACERLGGHLATITSAGEQSAIEGLLKQGTKVHYWLGATDSVKEGDWQWVTGEPFSYTNWSRTQPDNSNGVEHYLQIFRVGDSFRTAGKWNDIAIDCQSIQSNEKWFLLEYAGYICEWDNAGYTVTFDANGGTVSPASAQTGADGKLASLPVPVREGYAFDGWFTAAAGGEQVTTTTVFKANSTVYAHWEQTAVSGVTWRIENGTLYITGTGPMQDYEQNPPWTTQLSEITSAVIEDGITTIGKLAFLACRNMTSVTIPDSVTSIGSSAFMNCTGLTNITIPESVTTIGDNAFRYCNSLTNVVIPDGVTKINEHTFSQCTNLKSVTIPVSVTEISPYAFYGYYDLADVYYGGTQAQWNAISIGSNNEPLLGATLHYQGGAAEGVTWRMDGTTLYIEGSGRMEDIADYDGSHNWPWADVKANVRTVIIEDGVTSIGVWAFNRCENMTRITIPDSVTSIGEWSISGCTSLTSVTIPSSVTSIEYGVFQSDSRLSSVTIPEGVTSIGPLAFSCCNLGSVAIPSSVTSIGSSAFGENSRLKSVEIPEGVASIESETFFRCTALQSVTLPSSVTNIGSGAFGECKNLTDAYYPGTEAQWNASVTVGANNASLLNALRFQGGSAAEGVTWRIDGTTLYIEGNGAMESVKGHTTGSTSDGEIVIHLWPWRSSASSITRVEISDGITNIGQWAFNGFISLLSIKIPNSVTSIGYRAFQGCDSLSSVTIPAGTVDELAFHSCDNLKNVVLLPGVTSIGQQAFLTCSNMTDITIPYSVTSVGAVAFGQCSSLATVNFIGTQAQWDAFVTIADAAGSNNLLTGLTPTFTQSVSLLSNTAPGYVDVPADAWYAEAVRYCQENGLMNGTSDTEFSPDGTLTRAMMVTVLHRLAGKPAAATAAAFADVPAGKWYAAAVSWANSEKIVQGYGNGLFGADDPVTHGQVQLIFQRYSGDSSVQTIGTDTPNAPATRAEIAATLMAFAKKSELAPGTLSVFSAMNIMCSPSGLAADRDGSLLVTDVYHKQVWRVVNRASESYAGGATVQDLYGQPVGGYNDAGLDGSYFKQPWAIAPFLDGWAVSDTENNVVRLIQGGSVQTINGATSEKLTVTELGVAFNHPTGLAADDEGNLYVSDTFSGSIRKITPKGGVSTVAKNLSEPMGLCWKNGVLYAAETGKDRVVRIQDGKVSTVASGFDAPQGVAVGDDGSVYVSDTGNGAVRVVKDGKVTTIAARDMASTDAGLTRPVGLLVRDGQLYICDTFARKIFVYQIG